MKRFGVLLAFGTILIAAVVWLVSSTVYSVSESQKALVIRLGAPAGVVTEAGLHLKAPILDSVVVYDTRLLSLASRASEQMILGDQKRVEVQTYTLYRIADPLAYYRASRTLDQGRWQLTQIVSSETRREFGRARLQTLLSEERSRVMDAIRQAVAQRASQLGIDVVDVRLRRADLPAETSQSVYERMKSERQREAKELRAQGIEWAQEIQARADRERSAILADATRQSKILRGEGDATANKLYAEAAARAPDFFNFYRSLQTYHTALSEAQPTLLLSSGTRFLDLLKAGPNLPVPPQETTSPAILPEQLSKR